MTRWRVIAEDVICNLMLFALLMFPLSFVIYEQTENVQMVWQCLLLLPFFMLLYVIRRALNSIWLFVPSHIIAFGLVFLARLAVPELFLTILIFAVVCVVYSFKLKISGEPPNGDKYFIVGSFLCLLKSIFDAVSGNEMIVGFSILSEAVLAAGFMMLRHMKKVDISLAILTENRPDIDNRNVLRVNNTFTAVFVVFSVAIASIAPLVAGVGVSIIITAILEKLRLFAVWLFSFLKFKNTDTPLDFEIEPIFRDPTEALIPYEHEPSWFSRFFDIFLNVFVILLLAGVVGALIYIVFSALYKSFMLKKNDGDTIEELEHTTAITRILRRTYSRGFGSGDERSVRKLYYKTIKHQKGLNPKNNDTTRTLLGRSAVDIEALTKEYENVRYGK